MTEMLSFQHQVIVGCSSCGKASGRTGQVNVRPLKFLADHMTQTETQLHHQSMRLEKGENVG